MNNTVKVFLVKRWVDVSVLRIATTKGVCHVSGELKFTGQNQSLGAEGTSQILKDLQAALMGIPRMREVRWDLKFWKRTGQHWSYAPDKLRKRQDDLKAHD